MFHIAPLIILSIISAAGVIGNIFIIGSICLYKRLRVRGNAFLVNLAIADLIIVAYIMPFGLVTSQFDQNPFGDVMCQINAFLTMTSCGVSTQSLMLIAVERYFHICKMHIYRKAFTPQLIGFYIFLIWGYTIAWTCQGWTGWTVFGFAGQAYICIFSAPYAVSYAICLSIFGMFIPLIVLGICYYKIFVTVIRSRRAISAHRTKGKKKEDTSRLTRPQSEKQSDREYRLILTLFAIVIVFLICWVPAFVVLAISPLHLLPSVVFVVAIWMAMCNSCMNSFVYGIMNKNFRSGYLKLLRHLLCCTLYNGTSRCTQCQALLEDKNESTSSDQRPAHPKTTDTSGDPHSHTDSSSPKSVSTDCEDNVLPPSNAKAGVSGISNKPPNGRGSNVNTFQPIQYEEEPTSGAPIESQQRHPMMYLIESADNNVRMVNTRDDALPASPLAISTNVYVASSTAGSQSSLVHPSVNSEVSSMASGGYHNIAVNEGSSNPGSANQNRRLRTQINSLAMTRPRPSAQGRELSMNSVVLETKL